MKLGRRLIGSAVSSLNWDAAVAWVSVVKAAALFVFGGALMGLIRGSVPIGALSGAMFLCVCLVIGFPIIAFDHLGWRSRWKRKITSVPEHRQRVPEREKRSPGVCRGPKDQRCSQRLAAFF